MMLLLVIYCKQFCHQQKGQKGGDEAQLEDQTAGSWKEGRACMFIYGDLKFLYNIASFEKEPRMCYMHFYIAFVVYRKVNLKEKGSHLISL